MYLKKNTRDEFGLSLLNRTKVRNRKPNIYHPEIQIEMNLIKYEHYMYRKEVPDWYHYGHS